MSEGKWPYLCFVPTWPHPQQLVSFQHGWGVHTQKVKLSMAEGQHGGGWSGDKGRFA